MKKGFAFMLSLVLMFSAVPVHASHNTSRIQDDSIVAGYYLAQVIELIMTRYMGDEITIEYLFEAALRGMVEELDEFSNYLSAAELQQFTRDLGGSLMGIGINMRMRADNYVEITRVLPNSPAEQIGVMAGDVILYLDGQSASGMTMDDIRDIIGNPDNDRVLIKLQRESRVVTFDILKGEISSPTVLVERFENIPESRGVDGVSCVGCTDQYRYVQISSVGLSTGNDLRTAIRQMRYEGVTGILIDLRGNTGGYLDITIDIANQLVPQGVVLQTINQAGRTRTYSSTLQEQPFENIVVLVNRFTASAAEVIASALQDSEVAIIIGEQTFGKGLVQSVYPMPTGGALKITTEKYFRRNGGEINNIGVAPCIEVGRHLSASLQDPVLRRGIEVLVGHDQ